MQIQYPTVCIRMSSTEVSSGSRCLSLYLVTEERNSQDSALASVPFMDILHASGEAGLHLHKPHKYPRSRLS